MVFAPNMLVRSAVLLVLLSSWACGESMVAPAVEVEEHLLFLSTRGGDVDVLGRPLRDFYRIGVDDAAAANLTRHPSLHYMHASVSPDGRRVAFASDRDGCDVWVMNTDGSRLERVTGPGEGCNGWPRWSPDGTQLAFASNRGGRQLDQLRGLYDVYVSDAAGAMAARNVTALFAEHLGVFVDVLGWSPSGEIVIETHGHEQGAAGRRVHLVSPDGSGMRPFLDPGDHSPSWSPDGSKVAFIRERDGKHRLHIMNHDGTGIRPLTGSTGHDRLPNGCCGLGDSAFDISPWSPNGRSIAFERFDGTSYSAIHVVNADGEGLRRLTTFSASFNGWSGSGRYIALTRRTPPDPTDIYIMNANGSGLRNITSGAADDSDAIWVR